MTTMTKRRKSPNHSNPEMGQRRYSLGMSGGRRQVQLVLREAVRGRKECYGYNAARELDEIFEAVTNSDDRKRDYETCGDWYDFVCPIRAETDCCRNRIRAIGRCLGREVFDVGGDDCDDTCRGYDDDDKEAVGNVFDPDTFSTLVGLLTDYDLVGVLSGDDPITVS